MSAINPLSPSPQTVGGAKTYEPSMEEILASIRRIISDDQSLPGRIARADLSDDHESSAPVEPAGTVHVLRSGVEEPKMVHSSTPAGAAEMQTPSAHGSIAAPQYPTPAGPDLSASEQPSNDKREAPAEAIADLERPSTRSEPSFSADEDAMAEAPMPEALRHHAPEPAATPAVGDHDEGGDYFDPPIEYDRGLVPAEGEAAGKGGLFSAATNSSVSSAFNVLAATRFADNSEELLGLAREMIRPLLKSWLDDNLPSMVERMVRDEIERVARGGR